MTIMSNPMMLLLLFVSLLAFQQAYGQDDAETSLEIRSAANDKVNADGGNQPRTIYSQRHLSPHRMMHFGKRPVYFEPPMISTPIRSARDLFSQVGRQNPAKEYLTLEIGSGQTLQEIPDRVDMDSLVYNVGQPDMSDAVRNSAELDKQQRQRAEFLQQVNRALDSPRLLKLISNDQANESNNNDGNNDSEANNLEKAQASSNSQSDEEAQRQQQQQRSIRVNTRSSQRVLFPKSYISGLLAGNRQNYAQSLPSAIGSFNKKAEPKDNFFMHFGRK